MSGDGRTRAGVFAAVLGLAAGALTALSLNGTNEYVHSDRLHHYTSPTPYSVETWFRTASSSGGRIVGYGNNIGTERGHTSGISDKLLHLTDDGRLAFGVQSGSTRPTVTSAVPYNGGAWHHAVATQGPSGMVLYVDGEAVGTHQATGSRSYNGYWRVGAYVNGVAANTNYDDSQLASRGSTAYLSYLRFTLPSAPAGRVLTNARLTFRTSPDSTAGSADRHSIVPVTGAWTESAVTHTTRPALSTSVLGTITGAASVSTGYAAELDASALGGALGSATSLALSSSGTDSLRIWSSEATTAYRPQLVLTFGVE